MDHIELDRLIAFEAGSRANWELAKDTPDERGPRLGMADAVLEEVFLMLADREDGQ